MRSTPLNSVTRFCLLITASPEAIDAHLRAIRFVRTAEEAGYPVTQVFFYLDAVHIAHRQLDIASDEVNLQQQWRALAKQLGIELQICVAAAARRGLPADAQGQCAEVQSDFAIVGLGQLAMGLAQPDTKLIHFR